MFRFTDSRSFTVGMFVEERSYHYPLDLIEVIVLKLIKFLINNDLFGSFLKKCINLFLYRLLILRIRCCLVHFIKLLNIFNQKTFLFSIFCTKIWSDRHILPRTGTHFDLSFIRPYIPNLKHVMVES